MKYIKYYVIEHDSNKEHECLTAVSLIDSFIKREDSFNIKDHGIPSDYKTIISFKLSDGEYPSTTCTYALKESIDELYDMLNETY